LQDVTRHYQDLERENKQYRAKEMARIKEGNIASAVKEGGLEVAVRNLDQEERMRMLQIMAEGVGIDFLLALLSISEWSRPS
jgi:hypothetical protein